MGLLYKDIVFCPEPLCIFNYVTVRGKLGGFRSSVQLLELNTGR